MQPNPNGRGAGGRNHHVRVGRGGGRGGPSWENNGGRILEPTCSDQWQLTLGRKRFLKTDGNKQVVFSTERIFQNSGTSASGGEDNTRPRSPNGRREHG